MCNKGLSEDDHVYFIRHKEGNDVEKDNRRKSILDLMKQKRIAIFFENKPWSNVFDENTGQPITTYIEQFTQNHSTYRSALTFFWKLSSQGGYVVAEYLDGKTPNDGYGAIVSRIIPGTKVEAANGFEVTLKLDDNCYEVFDYYKHPVLLAIRPPFNTICEPSRPTYKAFVGYTLFTNEPVLSTELLHPKMVEQMCVEWLRKVGVKGRKLSYCTLRPGKSLAVVDICGILDDGKAVFAQVKNSEIDPDDLRDFDNFTKKYNDGVNIVFSTDRNRQRGNIVFVNIDDIFNGFKESNLQMLKKMAGI